MHLQQLQTSLCDIIKSRGSSSVDTCEYLEQINKSKNILLIRKIALWWRKFQIENFSRLTACYLNFHGKLDLAVWSFFRDVNYSSFREEVGFQFLEYVSKETEVDLLKSIAEFEIAVIKLKLGEKIQSIIVWNYEPVSVIHCLLRGGIDLSDVEKGIFETEVSWRFKEELFKVRRRVDS